MTWGLLLTAWLLKAATGLIFIGLIFLLGTMVSMPVLAIYLLITLSRRSTYRGRLKSLNWPRVWLTPSLLVFPDSAWRRLPNYEEAMVTPVLDSSASPRALLKETLRLLSPEGWQWAKM